MKYGFWHFFPGGTKAQYHAVMLSVCIMLSVSYASLAQSGDFLTPKDGTTLTSTMANIDGSVAYSSDRSPLGPKAALSQTVSTQLDSLFASPLKPINGNVLVAESGRVIYQKSFGFANFKNKIRNSRSSRFNIASVSKTFTSVAILQLNEKGKLILDDPVKKYLPEFPFNDITIRHLLSHTSGLPDIELYDDLDDTVITNQHILPSLNKWKAPLPFKPGEQWRYSNTNFDLLMLVVEKVSGQQFRTYLQENILSKARMSDTYLLEDYLHERRDQYRVRNHELPDLYAEDPIDAENKIFPFIRGMHRLSGLKGSGDIISTTDDLLKYDQSLYDGTLLSQKTLDEAFAPAKLNNGENAYTDMTFGKSAYGLGWFIFDDTSNGKIVWHTGGFPGTRSILLRNISKHQTVILLDNASSVGIYRNGVNAMNILNDITPLLLVRRSLVREYAKVLVAKDVDAAYCKLRELQADSSQYNLDEDEMNNMGLALLADTAITGHREKALEALKLNTLLFPESYNTYDSYGEALAKTGRKYEAVSMYKKSLLLNPQSDSGKKALEKLTRQ
jgi:CubicO group peptidase (beta-lactamase class C family)